MFCWGSLPAQPPSAEPALQKSERAAREEQRAAEDRRRALSAAQQEATRRQREAAHTDAVAGYQTLLAEVVKDPNLRWIDCRVSSDGTMTHNSIACSVLCCTRTSCCRLLRDVDAKVSNRLSHMARA